ncbi:MAG: histidine--tRNA ligase [Bdellovibrionales bacterium]
MSLQSVRGTHDLLPEECAKHRMVLDAALRIAELYGFREMSTPIFEFSEVFSRTLGDHSDIVTKEMYSFKDKGDEWLTLRPEGTAGIARAFISEGLAHQTPFKVFYSGPMFRYERPQKGRQRQFHQLGVELIGVASPLADLETLALADQILDVLGLKNRAELHLNSLGDQDTRKAYRTLLVEYLNDHATKLSADSQRRLTGNPLRILDSKDENDQNILLGAPQFSSSLTPAASDFFAQVQAGLDKLKISFTLNPRLVRGLDYYSHTVFEYRAKDLGAQDAILSGGRYDQLIETMGGPSTPGVGWAAGLERLVLLKNEVLPRPRPVVMVALGDETEQETLKIAQELRQNGVHTELTFSGNMSKRMKKAAGMNARYAVIIGADELKAGQVSIKDLDNGEQKKVPRDQLLQHLS